MPEPEEDIGEDLDTNEGEESEEEFYSCEEEETERQLSVMDRDIRRSVEGARAELEPAMEMVNVAADATVGIDARDATYSSGVEQGDVQEVRPGGRIARLRARAREYRARRVGSQRRKGRLFARAKGINLFLNLVIAGGTAISAIVAVRAAVRACNGGTNDSQLTDEQRRALEDQVRRWWALPDTEVWNNVAQYCDRWNPSWQAQILMMDTIKDMSQKLNPPWEWRDDDEADLVDQTENAYADFTPGVKQHQSSAIYRHVATLLYDGFTVGTPVSLPRQVAADVAELAIIGIVLKEDTSIGG